MKKAINSGIGLTVTALVITLAGCGTNPANATNPATTTAPSAIAAGKVLSLVDTAATVPDGAALYASNCVSCHGVITASNKIGADPTLIQSAITANVGGMGFLSTLTPTDIQAIATSLAPSTTGAALYGTVCLACHGGLSTTPKAGADITRIQNAVTTNAGGMGYLSTLLNSLQLQAIAAALTVVPSGTTLYADNCAICHGAIATSAKIGASFSRVQNAINSNSGGMGSLSALAPTDIQAITAVLTAP